MNKQTLRSAILLQLRQELARQTHAAQMARDEAISEESRSENKWDTHSQEAAYLAEGQAKLAGEISANIELYETLPLPDFTASDAVALGAIVELEAASDKSRGILSDPAPADWRLRSMIASFSCSRRNRRSDDSSSESARAMSSRPLVAECRGCSGSFQCAEDDAPAEQAAAVLRLRFD